MRSCQHPCAAAAGEVEQAAPKALVLGRHLLALGLSPGPRVGAIVEACYEAQLDGVFTDLDGGLAHLDLILKRTSDDV